MNDDGKASIFECAMVVALGCALLFLLSGCASAAGTNAKWYNPFTLFAGSKATAALKVEAKIDHATTTALRSAQSSAHETKFALNDAPESRNVEVARESNDATVAALDNALGPLPSGDLEALKKQVAGLLSDNAKLRTEAEEERQARRSNLAEATKTIYELKEQRDAAIASERKQAAVNLSVANQYRNLKFWIYGAIGLWVFIAFILPILGRAFPAVGAVASIGHAVVAPFAAAAASSTKRLAGDLVGGIHDLRERLKSAPLDKAQADAVLREWITEADGTAAKVDALRREKGLL
jgi:regulator of replication initiation timing